MQNHMNSIKIFSVQNNKCQTQQTIKWSQDWLNRKKKEPTSRDASLPPTHGMVIICSLFQFKIYVSASRA